MQSLLCLSTFSVRYNSFFKYIQMARGMEEEEVWRERENRGEDYKKGGFSKLQWEPVQCSENSWDIRLPSFSLSPLLFLSVFHSAHVTQPLKDLQILMSSSLQRGAAEVILGSGWGLVLVCVCSWSMFYTLICSLYLCVIVCVYKFVC